MPHTGSRRDSSQLLRLLVALTPALLATSTVALAAPGLAAVLPSRTVSLAPTSGAPGTAVSATVSGFGRCLATPTTPPPTTPPPTTSPPTTPTGPATPGILALDRIAPGTPGTVAFLWDGQELATATVDQTTGSAAATFDVPRSSSAGPHRVAAQCAGNPELATLPVPFTVTLPPPPTTPATPTLTPTPTPSTPAAPAVKPVSEQSTSWVPVAAGAALLLALLLGGLAGYRALLKRSSHRWVRSHVEVVPASVQGKPKAAASERSGDDGSATTVVALQTRMGVGEQVVEEMKR